MRIVLDTNVLVSALLSPFGPPAQLLSLIVVGSVNLVLDNRIYAEYRTVLARPKFKFDIERVEEVLNFIAVEGEFVASSPLSIEIPDRQDLLFLEVAITSKARVIVTGNQKHFPSRIMDRLGITIHSPGQFVDFFSSQSMT